MAGSPVDVTPRRDPALTVLLGVAIGLGALIRIVTYLRQGSLWFDELLLQLNVLLRSPAELLRPLGLSQSAPPGFLLLQKTAFRLCGAGELCVRAVPVLAGVIFLPAAWRSLRRIITDEAAVFATGLMAFSPLFTRYAIDAKPYGLEALVAVALIGWTADVIDGPHNRTAWGRLALGGVAGLWLSSAAVFVLAGAGAALLVLAARRRSVTVLWRSLASGAAWLIMFGILWRIAYHGAANSTFLHSYWENRFLALDAPNLGHRIVADVLYKIPMALIGGSPPYLPPAADAPAMLLEIAAIAWGAIQLVRRSLTRGVLVLAPPAIVIVASMFRLYPLADRLLLFVFPLLVALFALGLTDILARIGQRIGAPRLSLAACALWLLLMVPAGIRMAKPTFIEHARPAIQMIQSQRAPGEPVYVPARALPAWLYYTTDWRHPDSARVAQIMQLLEPGGASYFDLSRDSVAPGTGRELRNRFGNGVEIYGIASGLQLVAVDAGQSKPARGWAESEIQRLRSEALPCGWTLRAHFFSAEFTALQEEIARTGGRESNVTTFGRSGGAGARAAHVCFQGPV